MRRFYFSECKYMTAGLICVFVVLIFIDYKASDAWIEDTPEPHLSTVTDAVFVSEEPKQEQSSPERRSFDAVPFPHLKRNVTCLYDRMLATALKYHIEQKQTIDVVWGNRWQPTLSRDCYRNIPLDNLRFRSSRIRYNYVNDDVFPGFKLSQDEGPYYKFWSVRCVELESAEFVLLALNIGLGSDNGILCLSEAGCFLHFGGLFTPSAGALDQQAYLQAGNEGQGPSEPSEHLRIVRHSLSRDILNAFIVGFICALGGYMIIILIVGRHP